MRNHWTAKVLRSAGAILLVFGLSAEAAALDGFWHGVRSANWSHSVQDGVSNWYSEPPAAGQPLAVPDGTAAFAPGALRTGVNITEFTRIERLRFLRNVESYRFRLRANLFVSGAGLQNNAITTPAFVVEPGANLFFEQKAGLVNRGNAASAANITNRGGVIFVGESRGGDAAVTNETDGVLGFNDDATAQRMAVVNERRSTTQFSDRSTPGRATILNKVNARLLLHTTQGPAGDGKITAGRIENRGLLRLGSNSLTVAEDFDQKRNGTLIMDALAGDREGEILAKNVELDGTLVVRGPANPRKFRFVLIRAREQLFGRFAEVEIRGINQLRKPRVVYRPDRVLLLLD